MSTNENPNNNIDEAKNVTTDEITPKTEVPEGGNNTVVKAKQSFVSELFDYLEIFVIAALVVITIFTFFTRLCKVDGPSMEKTLFQDQNLIISNIGYTPKTGDIIVFHNISEKYPDLNEPIVKRVIATGGQWIDINFDTWTVRIADNKNMENAITFDESEYRYLDPTALKQQSDYNYPLQVPEGYLFVMGDNRNNSLDSRSERIGLVDERSILGRVLYRISPADVRGKVE